MRGARTQPSGTVPLTAQTTVTAGTGSPLPKFIAWICTQANAVQTLTGKTAVTAIAQLKARTRFVTSAKTNIGGRVPLAAHTSMAITSAAGMLPRAWLTTRALIARVTGSLQPQGTVGLQATTKMAASGLAKPSARAFLQAATTATLRGALKLPKLSLALGAQTAVRVSGALDLPQLPAALKATGTFMARGVTQVVAQVGLAASGAATLASRTAIGGATALQALGSATIGGVASIRGYAKLRTRTRFTLHGSLGLPSLPAALSATGSATLGGSAKPRGFVALLAKSLAAQLHGNLGEHLYRRVWIEASTAFSLAGRAAFHGLAHLSGQTRLATQSETQPKGKAKLSARTAVTVKGKAAPHGTVTLEGASTGFTVKGKLSKAKYLKQLAASGALRLFGQSLPHTKKHLQPTTVVRIPPIGRSVTIPEHVRMVQVSELSDAKVQGSAPDNYEGE